MVVTHKRTIAGIYWNHDIYLHGTQFQIDITNFQRMAIIMLRLDLVVCNIIILL